MKSGVWFVLIAAVAAASGFLLSRQLATPTATVTVTAPTKAASSPANVAAEPSAHVIPDQVPAVTLPGLNGKPCSLAEFHSPALVINFWATWCVPCRREIPLLRKVRREQHARGVEVVGIAVDFAGAVQKYARELGIDYPLMMGEEDGLAAAQSFGMDLVIPFTIFADARRRIVAVKVGELHADEAQLILGAIFKINANTLDIELAKADIAARMREIAKVRALQPTAPKS